MEETGDILQNVLAKLLRQWDARPERLPESLAGLRLALLGATRDILVEASRKHLGPHGWLRNFRQQGVADLDLGSARDGATSLSHRIEAEAIVDEALASLSESHRQAITRLGVHEKTVGNWCRGTIKRLDQRFRTAGLA
jgi:DNA-directed RNA polymerase specialized sigma24 family protein